MESFETLIETIKKPFEFLSKGSYSKISSVKDLHKRTVALAEKGMAVADDPAKKEFLKKLIVGFTGYEKLSSSEQKERVKNAAELIEKFLSKRLIPVTESNGLFKIDNHPVLDNGTFLKNEEKLADRVQFVKGVGPKIAAKFAKADIETVGDLLYFFPWRYEDRRKMKKIKNLELDEKATFLGEIKDVHIVYFRGVKRQVFSMDIEDETGEIVGKWFNFKRSYFEEKVRIGQKAIFTGKIKVYKGVKEIHHPEFEILGKTNMDNLSFGRIVPIYTETGGIYQKTLRKIMYRAIPNYSQYKLCTLPQSICKRYDLLSPSEAIGEIHFPDKFADHLTLDEEEMIKSPPYRSLLFSELFLFNLLIGLKKRTVKNRESYPMKVRGEVMDQFFSLLPFKLTDSQQEVIDEMSRDLESAKPMNRLLEGDVGSGKTVVALMTAVLAVKNGYQTAFMAPTEILANQIHEQASNLLGKMGLSVELLIGGQDEKTRRAVNKRIQEGSVNLTVGTHALIQEGVNFKNLGLVIVDEQHRFGVLQRSALREKGKFPHVLIMSATPIPRTLALTYYGDLDISTIKELPKGRKPIETRVVNDQARSKLYDFMKKELKKGRQAYIIYPIIEESEKMTHLLDATRMAKYLSENIFPDFRVELIHGRIGSDKKDQIMERFRRGEIDVLVSTTVIEVGIDVPNASVMVIEHPERFGLSQLHQLRGRVGRGEYKSYCFLLLGVDYGDEIKERLTVFKNTQDGFKLAEEDLKLRGPGDFFGVSQSGLPPFRLAKFPRDLDLLKVTREEAFELLKRDYHLIEKENQLLPILIKRYWKDKTDLLQVG